MSTRLRLLLALGALALLLVPAAAPAGAAEARHSPNMSLEKTIPYPAQTQYEADENFGTDVEFAKIGGKRYALAGSYRNGLRIVDITRPRRARTAAVYDCAVEQGDVQVFRQKDLKGRVFATFTNDYFGDIDSQCYRDAAALGFDVADPDEDGGGKLGIFIVDITKPSKPRTVSFIHTPQGSHNNSVHPSGNFIYNSNSDLITSIEPAIEIVDISNPSRPKAAGELPLTAMPGLGTESHDITFSSDGTRAYSAALSHGVIIDTTNPAQPSIVSEFDDESINVWHQADPYSTTAADGTRRDFLIVEDEFAGAAGPGVCPTGGVHIYDVTGENEQSPLKVGYWNITDVAASQNPTDTCTAHVFDIHEDEQIMTIAYYMGGVRVVDLSGLGDLNLSQGDQAPLGGMRQIGHYVTENANTWSAKTPSIERDGDFFLYGNDMNRGLDIYRFEAEKRESASGGRMLSPATAAEKLSVSLDAVTATATKREQERPRVLCLLKAAERAGL
jgi:hypothetical protein